MNKPSLSIEIASLNFLLQWNKNEKALYLRWHDMATPPTQESRLTKDVMVYFQVVRNLTGLGKKSESYKEKIHQLIFTAANENKTLEKSEDRVFALRKQLSKKLSKEGLHTDSSWLSVSTKLAWMCTRQNLIYDTHTVYTLEKKYCAIDINAAYPSFIVAWNKAYRQHKKKIQAACMGLYKLRLYVNDEWVLGKETEQRWFHKRVFDRYLMDCSKYDKANK